MIRAGVVSINLYMLYTIKHPLTQRNGSVRNCLRSGWTAELRLRVEVAMQVARSPLLEEKVCWAWDPKGWSTTLCCLSHSN